MAPVCEDGGFFYLDNLFNLERMCMLRLTSATALTLYPSAISAEVWRPVPTTISDFVMDGKLQATAIPITVMSNNIIFFRVWQC